MVNRIIGVSIETANALRDLQEAVTRREAATSASKLANERLQAQAKALFVRTHERTVAEGELESAQQAVEKAQANLVRALGGRAFDPATGDLV